ncbi:cyclase family protein [Sediminispirochaeta bajacaliforniensis]|uniref:cyclase family protein n=1 Tax=Sediminispirochaeta bajacaliforniensis TaxID=148 RepID=UPI000367E652|nr:cyclase family protein [Sediminispirochaeta bajacaliforniensis]
MNDINLDDRKCFDMSQPVYDHCPGWPTYEPTIVRLEAEHEKDGFQAEQIRLNSHTGTHMDAPFHFFPSGRTIDEIPIGNFMGHALLVDLRGAIKLKEGISPSHIERYIGNISKDDIILINTGWSHMRGFEEIYHHDWPYLTAEISELFVAKHIKGVGIDCMSIGGWYEGTGRPAHEVLLSHDIWAVEEIYFPDELMEAESCFFMALPLKWRHFSGAPVRAVGII